MIFLTGFVVLSISLELLISAFSFLYNDSFVGRPPARLTLNGRPFFLLGFVGLFKWLMTYRLSFFSLLNPPI